MDPVYGGIVHSHEKTPRCRDETCAGVEYDPPFILGTGDGLVLGTHC